MLVTLYPYNVCPHLAHLHPTLISPRLPVLPFILQMSPAFLHLPALLCASLGLGSLYFFCLKDPTQPLKLCSNVPFLKILLVLKAELINIPL